MKYLLFISRTLGSLVLAVVLLGLFAGLLALTTFMEVDYGTSIVQYFVYRSWWFYSLQFLLALNVLFSMVNRLPWKRRHLPFLCVHFGIIVLLWGCYVTVREKQEAHLTIAEGKSARFAAADGFHLAMTPLFPPNDFLDKEAPASDEDEFHAILFGEDEKRYAQSQESHRRARVEVPFEGGPFDWSLYDKIDRDVIQSYLFSMSLFIKLKGREKGTIFARDKNEIAHKTLPEDLRIETLQFLADSKRVPGSPLEMQVRWNDKNAKNNATESESVRLLLVPQIGSSRGSAPYEIGLGASHTMSAGQQLNFRVAESESELAAFLAAEPGKITSGLGVLVLSHEGKSHVISVDDLVRKRVEYEPRINELSDRIEGYRRTYLLLSAQLKRLQSTATQHSEENSFQEVTTQIAIAKQGILDAHRERRTLLKESRLPLGDSNYAIGSARFLPEGATISPPGAFHGGPENAENTETEKKERSFSTGPMISFAVFPKEEGGVFEEEPVDYMILFSSRPDMNTHANKFRVFGSYCVDVAVSTEKASGFLSAEALRILDQPRLDIIQSPQGRLHYRLWSKNTFLDKGEITTDENETHTIAHDSGTNVAISGLKFKPHDFPGYNIKPVVFEKNRKTEPQRMVKLRVSSGERQEEFWLRSLYGAQNPLSGSWDEDQVRYVSFGGMPFRISYENNELDLGFSLYLRRFSEKIEPGTRVAAQYSSLVDLRPPQEAADRMDLIRPQRPSVTMPGESETRVPETLRENVLIKMNQPGIFESAFTKRKFRVYQTDRRGPFGPQSTEFHFLYDKNILPGETRPRDSISMSVLSVNDDPGRGLKYLGSAMLVFGTAWVFYGRGRKKGG